MRISHFVPIVMVVATTALLPLAGCGGEAETGTFPPRKTSTGVGGAGASGGTTTSGTGASTGSGGTTGGASGGTGGSATGGGGGSGGTTAGTAGTGGRPTDAGGADTVDGGTTGTTFDVSVGPITLAPGEERTVCVDKKIAADHPVDLVKISSDVTKGGHHLVFYKSAATVETTTPFPCQTFRDVLVGTVPLFIAQKTYTELNFPPGVAYSLPANQMVRVELHFVNTTPQPLAVTGTVHLGEAKAGTVKDHANLMFYGNVGIILAPQAMGTVGPTYHAVPEGRKIFGLTGHQHKLGTGVTIELSTGAFGTGNELYKNLDWDDPPLTIFNPPIAPAAGQGLRFTCTYNNTTNTIVTFGENADQEMCFLWAYYYPDQGFDIGF